MEESKKNKLASKPTVGPLSFGRPGGGPGGGMMMGMGSSVKAKNLKGSLLKLAKNLKPSIFALVIVFIFAIASTIFTIVSPKILGGITNQIVSDYINIQVYDKILEKVPNKAILKPGVKGSDVIKYMPQSSLSQIPQDQLEKVKALDLSVRPSINFDSILQTVGMLIALYILSAMFSYLQGFLMSKISLSLTYKLRNEISEKISRLPLKYFDTRTHGDILSVMTNDIDTISQSLNQSLTQIITSFTTIIGIAIMMLTISWQLTIVAILVLPISVGFITLIVKKSQSLFSKQQKSIGEINGHIEEMYSGHLVVKVFNGEKKSIEKFNNINKDLYDSGWKSQFLSGLLMPIMTFIGNLGFVGVAIIGGSLAISGVLQIGDIQAFIQYLQQFTQPITQAANVTTVLQSIAAAAERIFEFLEEKEEINESLNPIEINNTKGHVTFDHVKFGYTPDKLIINDFTMEAIAGSRIAIVGPTGAGKTTIVNLLMRFYDVSEGSIKIDGVDIRDMKRADLRKLFGMVLQDTWLFNGTIKANIAYGEKNASDKDIVRASKLAQVDHFVRALPDSYDMILNESGDNISQGEKQLLTIARAMLANPPILILDEATSSVDTRTEVLIQKAMSNLMKGRTSFVIAHRLSTIKNADLILVMNLGDIVEKGSHEELIKLNGFYANLYNSQFAEN
ncbi:MAG: ABC transporter ATP-binding protein [bacterium]